MSYKMDPKECKDKLVWNPSALTNYQGPYPVTDIEKARATLIQEMRKKLGSPIRKKIGIWLDSEEVQPKSSTVSVCRDPNQGSHNFFDYIPKPGNHFNPFESTIPIKHSYYDLPHLPNRSCLKCLTSYSADHFESHLNGTFNIIKCDICDFSLNIKDYQMQDHLDHSKRRSLDYDMQNHLEHFKHRSASEYKAYISGPTVQLVAVVEKFVYENLDAIDHNCFVMCPACGELFGDIFSCGYHTKIAHDHVRGSYSLCHLMDAQYLNLLDFKTCKICDTTFHKPQDMNHHYDTHPEHAPLINYNPEKCWIQFQCMASFIICNRRFYSLNQCLSHLYSHCNLMSSPKKNADKSREVKEEDYSVDFKVLYIGPNQGSINLPAIDLEACERDNDRMVKLILAYRKPNQSRLGHKKLKRKLSGRQN